MKDYVVHTRLFGTTDHPNSLTVCGEDGPRLGVWKPGKGWPISDNITCPKCRKIVLDDNEAWAAAYRTSTKPGSSEGQEGSET